MPQLLAGDRNVASTAAAAALTAVALPLPDRGSHAGAAGGYPREQERG
jgi:hypothetical protein